MSDISSETSAKKIKKENEEDVPVKPDAMSSLFGDVYITHVYTPKTHQEICDAEVTRYKKELPMGADQNALTWWKNNSDRYSSLSVIAKKYLCIPATSVPSESFFNCR